MTTPKQFEWVKGEKRNELIILQDGVKLCHILLQDLQGQHCAYLREPNFSRLRTGLHVSLQVCTNGYWLLPQ